MLATSLFLALALAPQRVALPQAEPLPGVKPIVIVGRVLADGVPAPGIDLTVGVELAGVPIATVHVVSADDGTFAGTLPPPDAERRRLRPFVRVVEPGWQRLTRRGKLGASGRTRIDVAPSAGGTIELRVLAANGAPLTGAAVEILSYATDAPLTDDGPVRLPRERVRADRPSQDAVFDLHFEPRARFDVLVRAPGHGAACLRDLAPDPELAARVIEVRLDGKGRLAGELRSTDGTPLPHERLAVYPAELIDSVDPESSLRGIRAAREAQGGLISYALMTDAQGRFEFAGLQPGAYFVQEVLRKTGTIGRVAHATGSTVVLTSGSHRLHLELVIVPGAAEEGRAFCEELPVTRPAPAVSFSCGLEYGMGTLTDERQWTFHVEPGKRYAVGWIGSRRFVEHEIRVEPGMLDTAVELRLETAPEQARLVIAFQDPACAGQPATHGPWHVSVLSAASGVRVEQGWTRDSVLELGVPAGEYVLVVEPIPLTLQAKKPDRRHEPQSIELRLAPGERRALTVTPE